MLTTYCSSCGYPNLYASDKPKVCGKCKKPLSKALSVTSAKPITPSKPSAHVSSLRTSNFDYDEEAVDIPDIESLDAEVSDNYGLRPMKFGDIAKQKKTGYKRTDKGEVPNDMKQYWQEQAGNTKRTINIDEAD